MFDLTLTFDNGPTEATPSVLDLLAEHGARATFFVVGRQIARPDLRPFAERAAAEGHWIGNHTCTHTVALGEMRDLEASVREVAGAQALIAPLAQEERLFRPYANGAVLDARVLNHRVVEYLQAERYTVVLWNAVPRDWEPGDWVERAVEQCRARPWTVMVLHDGRGRALPGLERFLPLVKAAGARFRREFPPECVPIRRGVIEQRMDHLIAD